MFNHCFVEPLKISRTPEKRYITPDGNSYESVTSYIDRLLPKPQLHEWRKREGVVKAQAITDAAAQRGKSLHTAVQKYLLNTPIDLEDSPNTKSLFLKIKPFVDRLDNIRMIETPLYSDRLKLAGTPDTIAFFDGELVVADFKTSTKVKKRSWIMNYWLQTGFYAQMFHEKYGEMPSKSLIMFGVPDQPCGILNEMPMEQCIQWCDMFMEDPVAFSEKLEAYKKRN